MVSVTRTVFGELPSGGGTVEKFQLRSDQLSVDIISWGCTITALHVKDRHGKASDVVLGFAELEGYLQKQPYFGAVVGRVANRIAKGRFTVDGKEYHLPINREPNSLHGGFRGFDKDRVHKISVLVITTSVVSTLSPGVIALVEGTAFDLRKPVELGKHLQDHHIHGFDHNFCLKGSKEKHFCARVSHADSGRVLEVYTTQPGIQFYTGNFLDGTLRGKSGVVYPKHSAFCLETQNWPDAVNQPQFPSVLLGPGEEYNHTTWFKFSVA
ncbi:Galm [Phodopus roborovskii]|uniref:Galactose mutarotase n=1 Tax=Phodopus roborovskii TaxID=109678 RepID=A0AAU9YXV5_PHORO|nr:Galm [Phodopus roborovskii]